MNLSNRDWQHRIKSDEIRRLTSYGSHTNVIELLFTIWGIDLATNHSIFNEMNFQPILRILPPHNTLAILVQNANTVDKICSFTLMNGKRFNVCIERVSRK